MPSSWEQSILRHTGARRILRSRPLRGGSVGSTFHVQTDAGDFFVKESASPLPGMFESEARGLQALSKAASPLKIPQVIFYADDHLILEHLILEASPSTCQHALGAGLALLHETTSSSFGFECDNYCGRTPQPNPRMHDWVRFFGEQRLGHQISSLRQKKMITDSEFKLWLRFIERLENFIPRRPAPALIHGDLWAGNTGRCGDDASIFDPAPYYAHHEADFAIAFLFGGFGSKFLADYQSVRRLEQGHEERFQIYELYHLLNHANLFGGSYLRTATDQMQRFV